MPEGARDGSKNGSRSDEEAALSARLQRLGERLDQQKGTSRQVEPGPSSKSDPSAIARGFRLSTELVGGVAGRRVHRMGARSLARHLAVGDDRVSLARLRRRRRQCDACRRRFQRAGPRIAISEATARRQGTYGDGRSNSSIRNPEARDARPHRRARNRLHQLGAVHGDHRGRHLGAAGGRQLGRARWCRGGCNRSPSCPTNSSPTPSTARPARKG